MPSRDKQNRKSAASRKARVRKAAAAHEPKKMPGRQYLALRGKVWIEIGRGAAFTEPAADLLEQIEACGSLSEAARRLRFSYRRAWLLVDAMNRLWPQPLLRAETGGAGGGGTRVTDLGRRVLRCYRDLQLQLEQLLDQASEPFQRGTLLRSGGLL